MTGTLITPAKGASKLVVDGTVAAKVWKALQLVQGVAKKSNYVTLPAEPRIFELLLSMKVQFDERAQVWYDNTVMPEMARMRILAQQDSWLVHPAADKLLPFQRAGVNAIDRLGHVLLCDDTGLGKTLQAIVGLEVSERHGTVLVVCLNTLKLWWELEYNRWSRERLPVTVLDSTTRDKQMANFEGGWLIVNYRQLSLVPQLAKINWDWAVFDEGHTLCNRQTQTYEAAEKLKSFHKLIITATPYGNNPAEVWALLHLLYPDRYKSYWRFYELFVRYRENGFGGREVLGVRNEALLRRDLAPMMIRRLKTDVYPQLLEKTYQTIPLQMEAKQAGIYRTAAKEMLIELPEGEIITIDSAMAKITRLRQILSTPRVFGLEDTSIKLSYIEDFLSTYKGKVIIFTLFRATIEALMNRLDCLGIPFTTIWGGLTAEESEASRQRLIRGEARVLLGTIAGAGTGLNLREAGVEVVIFIDKHWNPTRQSQAEDRVHGIGQTGKVLIQNLYCPGTIDDLVEKILKRKIAMTEAVLGTALREELLRWTKP